jgi:predicted RNA-binding protein with PIN domain
MPVLIDGNNLLHAAIEVEPEHPPGRTQLCDLMTRWARRTENTVHVVFDGPWPDPPRARQISGDEIDVTFSEDASADAVMIHILETDSAARRLLVVSSDREIVRAAKRRRATTIGSPDFWQQVRRDLARPEPEPSEPPAKQSGLAPGESDQWLDEMGLADADHGPLI